MGRLLRVLLIAALLAGAAVLALQLLRRRRPAWPAPEPGWSPPAVAPVLTFDEDEGLQREIADAEAEGMRAPDWEPPVDVAVDETGRVVEPEPPAEEAVVEPLAAEDGGVTAAPGADVPPAGPVERTGEALAGDEEALRGLDDLTELPDEAVRQLFAEAEEFERAIAEFEQLEQAMAGTFGSPEPGAAPPEAFVHPLDDAETAESDADIIRRRFEELAAEPEPLSAATELERAIADAAAEGMAPPADTPPADEARSATGELVEPARAGAEPLFASLEEALQDVAPRTIQPPLGRSAESYLDEGNVYFNVGQFALAIDRYTQAILLDPELTAAYYNRANAYTRSGEFDRALADYNRALELLPNDADALNNRGMLFLYRGNYGAAVADFDAALALDPGDTTVMVNRGIARLHSGDAEGALQDFLTAAGLDPRDPAAQYGAAQAAAALGNREEALRHVERALALDAGYAREAAADPRLAILQGDPEFLRLLREAGRSS